MIAYLNHNAGAVQALATVALLFVTGWYAWTTRAMLSEAKRSRLLAVEPRVVAYLRVHEVHSNMVQLCIANLSGAAAVAVSASIRKLTEWPKDFDLQDSRILRDLSFMRAHEVLKFDVGVGPELFRGEDTAQFEIEIASEGLDGRKFSFKETLKVESVTGFGNWQIYGIDDVARRLKDISETLKAFTGFKRLKVETFDAKDRQEEEQMWVEQRERRRVQRSAKTEPKPDA
jgi:hypothetical protein